MANEKRLIDANALWEGEFPEAETEYQMGWNDALCGAMMAMRTVDAVEVVRCKDCKHCQTASWGERFCARKQDDGVYVEMSNLSEDDFCSYGERKDKDA